MDHCPCVAPRLEGTFFGVLEPLGWNALMHLLEWIFTVSSRFATSPRTTHRRAKNVVKL